MDRSGRVGGVYKLLVVQQKAAAIAAEPPPLPTGPFKTIVVDPPWRYGRDEPLLNAEGVGEMLFNLIVTGADVTILDRSR